MDGADPQTSRHFLKVYGSQRWGNPPRLSHTFATFFKRDDQADPPTFVQTLTLSWLPWDGTIKPLGGPEPGRNYTLDETLTWLDRAGSNLRWESPLTEIEQRLFDSASERFHELEKATLRYVMIDRMTWRPHQVSNCIHAVTDLPIALTTLGMAYTGPWHGIHASRFVYYYLSSFYRDRAEKDVENEKFFEDLQRVDLTAATAQESLLEALREPKR